MIRTIAFFSIIVPLFTIFSFSCNTKNKKSKEIETKNEISIPQKVSVAVLKPGSFSFQTVSNGIIRPVNKANLFFETTGVIKNVNVTNGSNIKQGEVIAVLYNEKQQLVLKKANENLKRAITELSSLLIGYGGVEGDTTSVSTGLLQNLKSQSGYTLALLDLESAQRQYNNTFLKSPFNGIVANIEKQPGDMITAAKPFCTVLNNKQFVVDFSIVEHELSKVKTGQTVKVMPMAFKQAEFTGRITEINPIVDKSGLIKVKALIKNNNNGFQLFSGMNAKVIIETIIPNSLFVPKKAVVLRSNKKVVFTYSKGKAKWKYVKTGGENSSYYLVKEGLKAHDTIIIDGAINLAHDAEVQITNR